MSGTDNILSGAFADLKLRLAELKDTGASLTAPTSGITNVAQKAHDVAQLAHGAVLALDDAMTIIGALGHGLGVLGPEAAVPVVVDPLDPIPLVDPAKDGNRRKGDTPLDPSKAANL